ncbi:MAG: hypothetical protein A2Y17_02185 [Clostridiales bacterium GWF2_38_85]|nr:MAG: hypothetical protein A2Y17_02185 [Clostridiales bacterium GWF2_38_85]HBL85109.1 hypothetical protein [Clostridiales bacterium]
MWSKKRSPPKASATEKLWSAKAREHCCFCALILTLLADKSQVKICTTVNKEIYLTKLFLPLPSRPNQSADKNTIYYLYQKRFATMHQNERTYAANQNIARYMAKEA